MVLFCRETREEEEAGQPGENALGRVAKYRPNPFISATPN
jgi:hypothetical protein